MYVSSKSIIARLTMLLVFVPLLLLLLVLELALLYCTLNTSIPLSSSLSVDDSQSSCRSGAKGPSSVWLAPVKVYTCSASHVTCPSIYKLGHMPRIQAGFNYASYCLQSCIHFASCTMHLLLVLPLVETPIVLYIHSRLAVWQMRQESGTMLPERQVAWERGIVETSLKLITGQMPKIHKCLAICPFKTIYNTTHVNTFCKLWL